MDFRLINGIWIVGEARGTRRGVCEVEVWNWSGLQYLPREEEEEPGVGLTF